MAGENKKSENFVSLQEIYDGYADNATKEKSFKVDILARHEVEFIADFLNIKKGHTQNVSTVMRDWYEANKVVKVGKTDKNDTKEVTKD